MVEKVIHGKTRIRRKFCAFHTDSEPILHYMVKRLQLSDGDTVLEPCAGEGAFIEKMLELGEGIDFSIDAMELNSSSLYGLKKKFGDYPHISLLEGDALTDVTLDLYANMNGYYSKIIANPPYGAWQDKDKRKLLKKIYGGYVRETYSLFLKRCINLLKENGRLVFIIPDTFLALHLHKDVRKMLVEQCKIEEILLIPSDFFPGINFGYADLCIITLTKNQNNKDNIIKVISENKYIENLFPLSHGDYHVADSYHQIPQREMGSRDDYAFYITGDSHIRNFIKNSPLTLGDITYCVTGFYSGDNKKFMGVLEEKYKGYKIIKENDIEYNNSNNLLNGLDNGKKYIPILKGGGKSRFIKDSSLFIRWDKEMVNFYKKDKKARFQNSQFYFQEGIGIPMVKTDSIHAFLLQKRLFDQSVVGIFPKQEEHLYYLLAFLNSDVCNKILKVINHTANNSANYIKKIPVILDNESIKSVNTLMEDFIKTGFKEEDLNWAVFSVNQIFNKIYRF